MTTTEYMDQVTGWTDGHLAKTVAACEDIRATTSPVKPGWQEATKLLNAVRYEQFARQDDAAFAERASADPAIAEQVSRIEANRAHRQDRIGRAYGRLTAVLSAALALTLVVGTPGATEAHNASRTHNRAHSHARQIVEFNRTRMPEAPRDERPNATYWDVDTFRMGYMAALEEQGIAAETIAALEAMGCAYWRDDASISC